MDFYDYNDSYSDNKKMKSKLYIVLGIIVLALSGLIIYFTITSINSTTSKKDDKKITQNLKDEIKTLDKTDTNSLLNKISDSDEQSNNSEENNSNNTDPNNDEMVLTGSSEEKPKEKSNPTDKPKSTQNPTENNTSAPNITNSTTSPTVKPVTTQTPTAAPTQRPTAKPTTKPTAKPNQNLGSTDEDDASGKSFYVNNPSTLYCTFSGTPNAYVNGYLNWNATDGSRVKQYWDTTLNSSGTSVITIKLTPGVHNYTFYIMNMSLNGSSNADIDVSVSLVNRM